MTLSVPTLEHYREQQKRRAIFFVVALAAVTLFAALWLLRSERTVNGGVWLLYFGLLGLILYNPRYGFYVVLWMALASDFVLSWWIPFINNFSSEWSIFYLGDWAIFSPLELALVFIVLSWALRSIGRRKLGFVPGTQALPMLLFLVIVPVGLAYGVGTGGDLNIALWEARYIVYLPFVYFIVVNLLNDRRQLNTLMWVIVTALFAETLIGLGYITLTLHWNFNNVQAITEHAAAIHLNTVFILVVATLVYGGSRARKIILPLMVPLMLIPYLVTQRRAGFLTLGLGLVLVGLAMFYTHRRLFWRLAPVVGVVGILYLGAFWNSSGMLGMPARAVRSITVGGTEEEASSNYYRVIENVNTNFNIHQRPLTGIGFGQKFTILVPMPDISIFPMWEYIIHNSVFWMWVKTGVLGFVIYLIVVSSSLVKGGQLFSILHDNTYRPLILTWTIYIFMHFTYAYVDMSWDSQSSLYLGTVIGVFGHLEHLLTKPIPAEPNPFYWGVGHALSDEH